MAQEVKNKPEGGESISRGKAWGVTALAVGAGIVLTSIGVGWTIAAATVYSAVRTYQLGSFSAFKDEVSSVLKTVAQSFGKTSKEVKDKAKSIGQTLEEEYNKGKGLSGTSKNDFGNAAKPGKEEPTSSSAPKPGSKGPTA